MEKEDYDLEVRMTYQQCQLIERALDFFTRILSGQFQELNDIFVTDKNVNYEKLREAINMLSTSTGQPYRSYGIHSKELPDSAREMYDMQQELRFRRSWSKDGKNPEKDDRDYQKMFGVNYDEPLLTSGKPNIWCRAINKLKEKLESI